MQTVPLPQLQVFLVVARLRSFSGAARELGVSTSAVSQSVRQLEEQLRVTLLTRTTRSVALTEDGRRLVERAGPAMSEMAIALSEVGAQPGEVVGRLKLTLSRSAVPFVIAPVLPTFCAKYPRVEVEVVVEERFVDIVAEGYDAGVRLTESIERDMVQVRLTDAFRFVVVASPAYLAKHGTPQRPEDLLRHTCITFRMQSTGALYAWELERGKRSWRVPVRGGLVMSDSALSVAMAEAGMGLAYAFEPAVLDAIAAGRLVSVLDAYAPTVPGFFLYYPTSARRSVPLRLFVDTAKALARKAIARPR